MGFGIGKMFFCRINTFDEIKFEVFAIQKVILRLGTETLLERMNFIRILFCKIDNSATTSRKDGCFRRNIFTAKDFGSKRGVFWIRFELM